MTYGSNVGKTGDRAVRGHERRRQHKVDESAEHQEWRVGVKTRVLRREGGLGHGSTNTGELSDVSTSANRDTFSLWKLLNVEPTAGERT